MSLVEVEGAEAYAWIRLNRPDKRNAMNQAARDALRDALWQVRERYRVVILTGNGSAFCAGIDLDEVRAEAAAGSEAAIADWRALNLELREHPAIFIAAINGIALGGGVTLVSVCDLALAAEDAELGLPELSLGTYPSPSGPAAQIALTRKRAAWLVLTAERIDGRTAAAWGLVNAAVPAAELEARAAALATRIASFDAAALRESKRALDRIPLTIDSWHRAFASGAETSARIRQVSRPFEDALEHRARPVSKPSEG
jgi:enoyl-CoA hydratase/carnithine racemase